MTTAPVARPRSAPLPRRWGVTARDAGVLLTANGVFIILMWVRHGGLEQLGTPAGVLTAGGQLTARITDVTALQLPDGDRRSAQISQRAEPVLRSQALRAQGAGIDGVLGATYTSIACARSLQAALDAVGA